MNRGTYFITMASTIFPLMALYLAVVVGLCRPSSGTVEDAYKMLLTWPIRRTLMFWGNLLVLQIMLLGWGMLVVEQHNIVLYTETELRSAIERITNNAHFWAYENFLIRSRDQMFAMLGEGAVLAFGVVGLAIITFLWPPWRWGGWDIAGISLNAVAWAALLWLVRGAVQIRHRWERHLTPKAIKM
jgi:hypothetical protein